MKKFIAVLIAALIAFSVLTMVGCKQVTQANGKVVDLEYTAPKGFEYRENAGNSQRSVFSNKAASVIIATKGNSAKDFYDVTQESMEEKTHREIDSFDRMKIAGLDAYRIAYAPDVGGDTGTRVQIQYRVNVNGEVYVYDLIQIGDDNCIDAFDKSVQNIEPIYE